MKSHGLVKKNRLENSRKMLKNGGKSLYLLTTEQNMVAAFADDAVIMAIGDNKTE